MVSRLLALCVLITASLTCRAEEFVYTDACTLPLFGKVTANTAEPYSRLPESMRSTARKAVWERGRTSAGMFIRFSSDAGAFSLRWSSTMNATLDNTTLITVRGLSLYVLDRGEWVYVGAPRLKSGKEVQTAGIPCSKLEGTMNEYMLYLSMYDGVGKLEIGVKKGCSVLPPKVDSPKAEKPVIIYGTSILQGASASHPGMAGSNLLSRQLDRVVINLGFSGNALLDEDVAQYMASYPDPSVFVLDNLPNGSAKGIEEKEEKFFRILRNAHPDVPVVFVEHPYYPAYRFDDARVRKIDGKNAALEAVFNRLRQNGEKGIYLVSMKRVLLNDNVGTVEGTHFTDIGFLRYADTLGPVLQALLDGNAARAERLARKTFR